MYKFTVVESDSGTSVYINLITSSAGHYLNRRPYVIALIKEILSSTQLSGKRIVIEQDMGRNIGTTDIVATSETDTIYYAQPIKSEVFSRFAKNRYPQTSTTLTITAIQDTDGNYEIIDTWIGPRHPALPGDEHETVESKNFWMNHAFVQDALAIQSKSITKLCPY